MMAVMDANSCPGWGGAGGGGAGMERSMYSIYGVQSKPWR